MAWNIANRLTGLFLSAVLLLGCVSTPPRVTTPTRASAPTLAPRFATPTITPKASPLPPKLEPDTPTVLPTSPLPTPTTTATRVVISSPLQGISVAELPDILTQEFIQPRLGQDDGHFGVDYAYYRRGDQLSILGTPVLAVLPGRVAAVLVNRPPFGHAVMVETPLDSLPADWVAALALPPLPDPLPLIDRVPCDLSTVPDLLALPGESIYIIYAHFNITPTLQMGAPVHAGFELGEVGNSGYSGNPHLHIETHVGPAGVAFGSLGFYETGTTEEERRNYCLWRMSGVFRVFDPRELWEH